MSSRFGRRRVALVALALAIGVTLVGGPSAPASSPSTLAVIARATLPFGVRDVVRVPRSTTISGAVVLQPRDDRALTRFIASVSDPASTDYGRYLAQGAFAHRFGPSQAALDAVETQLRTDGLHLGTVSRSRLLVPFTATSAQVHSAFDTTVARYRLTDGASALGTRSSVRLPASVAPYVATVVGLSSAGSPARFETPHPTPAGARHHPAAQGTSFAHPGGSPRPCAAASAAARTSDGLTDDQIANAYGAFGLYAEGDRGSGQRIALYENEPFLKSDVETFDRCYFGAARAAAMMKRLHTIPVTGGEPTGPGSGEASLDVENVSAMAPGAEIDVYEGPYTGTNPTDYDSLDEYAAIIDADRDPIVSTSWGLCEQAVETGQQGLQQAENLLFQQAAAQGQTIFAAAGDNGSDDCNVGEGGTPPKDQNPVSVDDPASQPYVVAVGGTSILDSSRAAPLEQVWNNGPGAGAGGGGISQSWAMPSWQRSSTVPGIALPGGADWKAAQAVERGRGFPSGFCQDTIAAATASTASTACRLVPDVSAEGDSYTGSVSVYSHAYAGSSFSTNGWTTIGGTSSATPIWAAMLALIDASPTCTANPSTAHGVGFLSPQLYALASNAARYRASLHDITAGDNDVDGLGGGRVFAARPGYDLASGLGSPQLTGARGSAGLAYYLCAGARQPSRPLVSGLSPQSGSIAGGETVTVTGSGFGSAADPDVTGIEVGTGQLAAGSFRVLSPTSLSFMLPAARVAPLAPDPQDGAGPAEVIVTLRGGASSTPGPPATFDYLDDAPAAVPSVDAITPSGGLESAPRPVRILGAGFTGATAVSFGGVPAASFTVQSPYRIIATPPAMSGATACAPLPSAAPYAGEDAASDVCQVAVRVVNGAGASASAHILPPFQGMIATNSLGVVKVPAGCGCEDVAAPNEYDYAPTPTITSLSTARGPAEMASERGGTVLTIHGRGLDPLTLDWADFGTPGKESSQDVNYVFLSGTEIQIEAPPQALSVVPRKVRISVHTLGGQSAGAVALYAGVPRISEVVNPRSSRRLHGAAGADDAGGTPIRVLGRGLAGQLTGPLRFQGSGGDSNGTQFVYRAASATELYARTVGELPGLVVLRVCTVTGCSAPTRLGRLLLYPGGAPLVTAVAPSSGSAAGGTKISVTGENLSCPIGVYFGALPGRSLKPLSAQTGCGVASELRATSPPGAPGTSVPVRVETAESYFTSDSRGKSRAGFRYVP